MFSVRMAMYNSHYSEFFEHFLMNGITKNVLLGLAFFHLISFRFIHGYV